MAIVTKVKNRTYYQLGKPWWQHNRTCRSQVPLLDGSLPLAYFCENYGHEKRTIKLGLPLPVSCDLNAAVSKVKTSYDLESSAQYQIAYNRAYAQLWDTGGVIPQSELGTSVAEGREAIKMIIDRSRRLGSAYTALKKGKFRAFLYFLGTRPKKRHENTSWTRPKDASSLWLEYWLGWAPLVGDIYNSLEVLVGSAFWQPITLRGKGSQKFWASYYTPKSSIKAYGGKTDYEVSGRVCVHIGCQITVTNPNHFFANQLGLVNPLAIAWAVVPFSFIVDWFVNVGKMLNGMTDFVGVTQSRAFKTRYTKFTGRYEEGANLNSSNPAAWQLQEYTCSGGLTTRQTLASLPGPSLRVTVPSGLAITRGATAISLLVSIFTRG